MPDSVSLRFLKWSSVSGPCWFQLQFPGWEEPALIDWSAFRIAAAVPPLSVPDLKLPIVCRWRLPPSSLHTLAMFLFSLLSHHAQVQLPTAQRECLLCGSSIPIINTIFIEFKYNRFSNLLFLSSFYPKTQPLDLASRALRSMLSQCSLPASLLRITPDHNCTTHWTILRMVIAW